MTLADNVFTLVGGVAGATLIYFIVMGVFAYLRHKREEQSFQRLVRIERMTRDLWIDWMRRGAK